MYNKNCIYNKVCNLKETEKCNNECLRYIEITNLLNKSKIPKNMQKTIDLYPDNCDYDSFVKLKHIKESIKEWVNSKEFNLYIYSNHTGNGKTSWAIKLMLKYFDEIWAGNGLQARGLFINVPNFLSKLKEFNTVDVEFNEIKKLIPNVDLIIWDDISSTKVSDYDNSQLLNYIDQRILNGKSNIFTSNVSNDKLTEILGNRLTSRIWNSSIKIELKGKDRRGDIID